MLKSLQCSIGKQFRGIIFGGTKYFGQLRGWHGQNNRIKGIGLVHTICERQQLGGSLVISKSDQLFPELNFALRC